MTKENPRSINIRSLQRLVKLNLVLGPRLLPSLGRQEGGWQAAVGAFAVLPGVLSQRKGVRQIVIGGSPGLLAVQRRNPHSGQREINASACRLAVLIPAGGPQRNVPLDRFVSQTPEARSPGVDDRGPVRRKVKVAEQNGLITPCRGEAENIIKELGSEPEGTS